MCCIASNYCIRKYQYFLHPSLIPFFSHNDHTCISHLQMILQTYLLMSIIFESSVYNTYYNLVLDASILVNIIQNSKWTFNHKITSTMTSFSTHNVRKKQSHTFMKQLIECHKCNKVYAMDNHIMIALHSLWVLRLEMRVYVHVVGMKNMDEYRTRNK